MKKIFLGMLILGIMVVGVSAALLSYYGVINFSAEAEQAVTLDGFGCNENICSEEIEIVYAPDTRFSNVYTLTNEDPVNPRIAELTTECSVNDVDCIAEEFEISYWKPAIYTFDEIRGSVDVEVTDDGEWLSWIYTYAETPTHTPKMTVAIDFPNGFIITTYDGQPVIEGVTLDITGDTWYYASDIDNVPIVLSSPEFDWVQTSRVGNVLTVSIKKASLPSTFEWHGYANYNGMPNWIGIGPDNTDVWTPAFSATIRTALDNPITLSVDEEVDFIVGNDFTGTGDYTLATTASITA